MSGDRADSHSPKIVSTEPRLAVACGRVSSDFLPIDNARFYAAQWLSPPHNEGDDFR